MSEQSLEALYGLVILKLDPPDEKFSADSEIEIPAPARDMKLIGTVMHAGPGRVDVHGILHPTELKPGDKVIFARHLGIKVWVNGEEFYQIPEKHIFLKYLRAEEAEPDLNWLPEEAGVSYEYINVEDGSPYLIAELCNQGWCLAALAQGTTRMVWMSRDVYKYAPKIQELTEHFQKTGESFQESIENLIKITEPENKGDVALIKALAEWAPDTDQAEWKDAIDEKIEKLTVGQMKELDRNLFDKTLPPNTDWEYLNHLVRAYYYEPGGAEWQELARLKKEGWQFEDYVDNGQMLQVTKFKRVRRQEIY